MGRILQRHLGKLLPGQYVVDKPCLFVACPSCGGIDDISVTQPPMRSGLLPGKWRCLTVTCGFEDFLTLGDWNT